MTTTVIHGDCRVHLPSLPTGRFRTCVTSPPYLWQRKYLPDGHLAAALELGREPSIAEYVDQLVGVFREVRRVLADDGTLWLNLGDGHANDLKWGGATGGRDCPRPAPLPPAPPVLRVDTVAALAAPERLPGAVFFPVVRVLDVARPSAPPSFPGVFGAPLAVGVPGNDLSMEMRRP